MSEIPYARQEISNEDVRAVAAALKGRLLTQGPKVAEFEERFASTVDAKYAVAVNSGTAALHTAYFAAGIKSGSGVLTAPITFVATANASLYLGGSVKFVDVDPLSILLDPQLAEQITDQQIAAIAPIHFTGNVAPLEEISSIARRRGWLVIEDAAHALGASYRTSDGRDHKVGACAHSDMCCFSFHAVKHVTTGEGGAVTTNDERLYKRLLRFRNHGITREHAQLSRNEGPWYYEQQELGFNYRITDFQCALGLTQLRRLDRWVERRREIADRYNAAFRDIPGITPLANPSGSKGSYHLYVVRVSAERRKAVFLGLRSAGIEANVHYIPVHMQPYYRESGYAAASFPNAERYYSEALTLPLFPKLSDRQIDKVVRETVRLVSSS